MAMWSLETIAEKTAPPTVSARSTWHIMPVTSALRRGPGFKVFMRELERVGCSWFSWTTLLCELHAIYLLHTPALPIQSSNSWPLDPICRCMSISKHCVFFLKHLYDSANLKKKLASRNSCQGMQFVAKREDSWVSFQKYWLPPQCSEMFVYTRTVAVFHFTFAFHQAKWVKWTVHNVIKQ